MSNTTTPIDEVREVLVDLAALAKRTELDERIILEQAVRRLAELRHVPGADAECALLSQIIARAQTELT